MFGSRRSSLPACGWMVRRRSLAWAWLALAALLGPSCVLAREKLNKDSRIALIRGLSSEVAVTKVALPRGKKGVFVDSKGKLDEAKAKREMRQNGAAIGPGMPAKITRITFKPSRIVFDINGGGKSGKKWYQHIEVGVGTATSPIAPDAPVLAFGSSISLAFPGSVPDDLTVAQVKQLLSSVLDFERRLPTVLYSPALPPEFKEAIKKHQVLVGMDRETVLSAKGPPDRKVREVRNGSEQEDWIYGLPPHVLFVSFDGDTVVSVRQY